MDYQEFANAVLAAEEPARLHDLLVGHCDWFDDTVAEALKDRIDQINRADPRQALDFSEAGISAAEHCSNPIAQAWMLWARAHAQMQLEDYQTGLASCDAALEILQAASDMLVAAQVRVSRLFALVNLGREETVIQEERTLRITLERHGDQFTLARLDMNVGIAYDDTDRHEQALRRFESAAARFEALAMPLEVLRARINAAIALEYLDRYDDALRIYSEVRPALVELDKPMVLARNDFNMAVLHFWLGDYAKALQHFKGARRTFQELDVPAEVDQVDLYRAMLYLEMNQFSDVIVTCEQVEERAVQRGIVRDVLLAQRLTALARGYRRWPGDWGTAVALLERVRDRAAARGTHLQATQVELDIALLLLERDLPDQALSLATKAADFFSRRESPVKQARAQIVCGQCLLRLNRLEEAREQFQQAIAVAENLTLIQLAFPCHHGLGQIAEAQGKAKEARHLYDRALSSIERLREHILVDDFRASFLKDKLQTYADAAHLCLREGDLDAAFGYVERAKARVLLDLISAAASSAPLPEPEEAQVIREQLRALERRWNALQSRKMPDPREPQDRSWIADPDTIPPQVQCELASIERQMLAARRELQVLNPSLAGLTGGTVLSLADLQSRLPEGITLIEYFAVDDGIVAFVISKDDCHLRTLEASSGRVTQLTREVLTDFQAYQPEWDAPIRSRLRTLYEHLLKPIRPLLRTRHLVLVPHGPLYHVPFSALHDGDRHMVEVFEFSYAPSATVHALSEGRTSGGTQNVILAFSDAGRIPGTLREVTYISEALSDAIVLCEDAATADELALHADQARVLHLATHGYFRGDNPLFSTLRLSGGDLTVAQVYDLRLQASLVTLSACETGLSYLQGSDLIGLAGAFLYAGAASMVVSLWHVQDESTACLMQNFYHHLTQGQSKAAALRSAQLELLNHGRFGMPFHWAPFVLYGDAGLL